MVNGHGPLEPVPSVEGQALFHAAGSHHATMGGVHTTGREATNVEDVAAQWNARSDCILGGPPVLKAVLFSRPCRMRKYQPGRPVCADAAANVQAMGDFASNVSDRSSR